LLRGGSENPENRVTYYVDVPFVLKFLVPGSTFTNCNFPKIAGRPNFPLSYVERDLLGRFGRE
jgi:hypothetical protein